MRLSEPRRRFQVEIRAVRVLTMQAFDFKDFDGLVGLVIMDDEEGRRAVGQDGRTIARAKSPL